MATDELKVEMVPKFEDCWRNNLTEKGFSKFSYRNPTSEEYEKYLMVPKYFGKYLMQLDRHGNMYDEFKVFGSGEMRYEDAYTYSMQNHLEAAFFRICGYTIDYARKQVDVYRAVRKSSDVIPMDADEAVLLESSLPSARKGGSTKVEEKDNSRLLSMPTVSYGVFKSQIKALSSENLVEFDEFLDKHIIKLLDKSTVVQKDKVLKVYNDNIYRVFEEWRADKF